MDPYASLTPFQRWELERHSELTGFHSYAEDVIRSKAFSAEKKLELINRQAAMTRAKLLSIDAVFDVDGESDANHIP